jgi:hypothetical protein
MTSSGAAAAAARLDAEFCEYGTAAAISTLNPLLDEAVGAAYGKGGSASANRSLGYAGPDSMSVDRTGDGKVDTKLTFTKTVWGNLDTVSIDSDADGKSDGKAQAKRSLGKVQSVSADLNNDGKNDMKITVNRNWLGHVKDLEIDTNSDGKADHKFTPEKTFWGKAAGFQVDIGANGTNDGYIEFVRNGWGNIDKLVFHKKKP